MWTFFCFSMVGVSVAIFWLIRRFAAKNVARIVIVATAYAWLTAMMIIALVPIDVWSTKEHKTSAAIGFLWDIAYWSTQAGTWLVLPFYQIYSEAGDFTVRAKAWTSIKENAILYGAVGALGLIGILILLFTKTFSLSALIGLGIFLSNAAGLIGGIVLLGYGLVEIPRTMWITSNPKTQLKWCAHRAGKFAEAVMRATNELENVVTVIYANEKQMRRTDPLRKYMDKIVDYAERESPVKPSQMSQRNIDMEGMKAEDLEYNFDVTGLADLRRRLFYAIDEYRGTRAKYVDVMVEAFDLEDVVKCRQLHDYTPRAPIVVEKQAPASNLIFLDEPNPLALPHRPWTKPLWVYKCRYRPVSNKVFAVLLGIVSLMIVWSEATIPFEKTNLSPFGLVLLAADHEFTVQLLVLLPLAYICACSYMALFRINIQHPAFSYNKLIRRATTGAALMQNGSLMCRFAAPTCWNFYHIIRFTQETGRSTVFSEKMASMDVTIPNVNLNLYLPIVLVVQCSLVALNLWEKLLNSCVSSKYKYSSSTDDVDDEYTEKGRQLVRKEQESALMGLKIGEVLHSAYFDLEFPTIAKAGKAKKGMLGFFQKHEAPDNAKPPSASGASTSMKHVPEKAYNSAAAQAASRWTTRGATTSEYDDKRSMELSAAAEHPRTSLLAGSQHFQSSSAPDPLSSGGGSGGFGRLDGIFASIAKPSAAPSSSAAAPSSTVSAVPSRLVLGSSSATAAVKAAGDSGTASYEGASSIFSKWGAKLG